MDTKEKRQLVRDRGGCESKAKTPCKGQVQIHHVDRNPKNEARGNLKVFCEKHHPAPGARQGAPKTKWR
jgi:hypothetical protein